MRRHNNSSLGKLEEMNTQQETGYAAETVKWIH
jgi:hypothetical protein